MTSSSELGAPSADRSATNALQPPELGALYALLNRISAKVHETSRQLAALTTRIEDLMAGRAAEDKKIKGLQERLHNLEELCGKLREDRWEPQDPRNAPKTRRPGGEREREQTEQMRPNAHTLHTLRKSARRQVQRR